MLLLSQVQIAKEIGKLKLSPKLEKLSALSKLLLYKVNRMLTAAAEASRYNNLMTTLQWTSSLTVFMLPTYLAAVSFSFVQALACTPDYSLCLNLASQTA